MPQEQMVLHRIDWQSTFAFTRLFGGFRSALHSTKIVLALAGLLLTFLLGGVLDFLWVHAGQGVWPGEITGYTASGTQSGYVQNMADIRYGRLADILLRTAVAKNQAEALQQAKANPSSATEMAEERLVEQYRIRREAAGPPEIRAQLHREMQSQLQELNSLRPIGPFHEFAGFQMSAARNAVFAATQMRFTDGLDSVVRGEVGPQPSVLGSLVMLWYGLIWLLKMHYVYALFFGPAVLAIWSLAGGGISRAAIVQFAKDERIGIREALRFAAGRFWGFFFAPIVSFAFILAFGLLLIAAGLVGSIPFVGDILVGVLWFLALVAGLAIAFITIGLLAGGSIFAPVVAAEGSDAFDAISRGFVYVYSRPWKSILYGVTLVIYGSLCYLFLRFFVFLMLSATHAFVGAGMLASRPESGPGLRKLDVVWQAPTFADLRPHTLDWQMLGVGEVVLFFFIAVWTYLVWGVLQSWLISFYFSGSSMAYLLLRKDVDAIDIEEIYAEEEPEPETLADAAAAPAPAAATPPAPAAAAPQTPVADSPSPAAPPASDASPPAI